MTKALFLAAGLVPVLLSNGCFFSKKSTRAKESSTISADVEESFRRRWVEKRTSELTVQGASGEAARTQAESEFRERFGYTRAGSK